jgi:hypothetical protein
MKDTTLDDNQHAVIARKLISGRSPTAKTMLLSLNRTQSKVVNGHPAGHNTREKIFT